MKKIFTYLVIIFVTSLTLSCNDDKSDNSKPDYISPSLTEWIFKSKGEQKEIIYAEPNEENQERKTELKIENELL